MKTKNMLYFTRTMGVGGTEKVILQLCRNFSREFNKIIVCSMGGVHEIELANMGIKHYKICDIQKKDIISIISILKSLKKIIIHEEINIVHTHHRMAAFYINILKCIFQFEFIHTAHNTFSDKKLLTKIALHKAKIIAVGEKVKVNLCDFYELDKNKIKVIYNGVEKDDSDIVEIPEISKWKKKGCFVVGNIGRLSEQKGMKYYIEAIPKVLEKNKKIIFLIIGDGEEREKLQNLSNSLRIDERLIFLGYRNDINNIIKQLDLVVLSSLWEGLPLTPIEAFSAGKTVIGTNVDGTCEIIEHMKNGILIKPKDSEAIEKAIINVYKDKKLIRKMESNALLTYKNKFSLERVNKEYRIFYENLMI